MAADEPLHDVGRTGPGSTVTPIRSGGARLARSAGLIGSATLVSRVLGLVRDQTLAYLFGAGNAMDAFNVAFRIPNLVRDLFAEGAMTAAFVPTFTKRLTIDGRERAWNLGNAVLNALGLVTGVLVVAGIVGAEPLTALFAASYAGVPGKLELTVFLTRLMLPFLTLVALAAVVMGMLNSLERFFVPALSPAMFNVAMIASAVLLVPLMPALGFPAITAIAVGVVAGGLGQLALQWPALRREGFRYEAHLDLKDPGLREILTLMGPGTIGLAATQVNLFVNTVLATGEGTGAVSWLNYAFRLMYLPIGLFGVSIATAALPSLARDAARDQLVGMRETVSRGLRLMMMLNVPAAVGLMVLASPIVRLIFERGRFTAEDTAATAAALLCYAPGLLGYSAVKIAVPGFYALHDARTPVTISIASMAVNVSLNLMLVRVMGYRGLALGTAVAAIFNATTLLWLLRRRLGGFDDRRLAVALGKIGTAAGGMGLAVWLVDGALQASWPTASFWGQSLHLLASIGSGIVSLAIAARLLGIQEFALACQGIMDRFARRRRADSGPV